MIATLKLANSALPTDPGSKESLWEGYVTYPQSQERVCISVKQRQATFLDTRGKTIGEQGAYELDFAFISTPDRLELTLQDRSGISEETVLRIEELVARAQPFAFDPEKQKYDTQKFFRGCRFVLADTKTMRVSGPGIPETIFRRIR